MKTYKTESGRSMIEMLGVLAIIGVLSVGGIAGYSKAMQKYRINKTIEQITLIAGNVRAFFAPQKNYNGLNAGITLIKKAKLVPDEMWEDGKTYPQNVFGGDVVLSVANKAKSSDYKAFRIGYKIPYDMIEETCVELLSYNWTDIGFNKVLSSPCFGPEALFIANSTMDINTAVDFCTKTFNAAKTAKSCTNIFLFYDVNDNCWNERHGNTCS